MLTNQVDFVIGFNTFTTARTTAIAAATQLAKVAKGSRIAWRWRRFNFLHLTSPFSWAWPKSVLCSVAQSWQIMINFHTRRYYISYHLIPSPCQVKSDPQMEFELTSKSSKKRKEFSTLFFFVFLACCCPGNYWIQQTSSKRHSGKKIEHFTKWDSREREGQKGDWHTRYFSILHDEERG